MPPDFVAKLEAQRAVPLGPIPPDTRSQAAVQLADDFVEEDYRE